MSVEQLRMDVDTVRVGVVRGRGQPQLLLHVIERSAEARKALRVDNQARFRRLSIEGNEKAGVARLTDTVLYRGALGYLVKPSHPLWALVLLLLTASFVRSAPVLRRTVAQSVRTPPQEGEGSSAGTAQRAHDAVLACQKAGVVVLSALAPSLAVAVQRKPNITLGDAERVRSHLAAVVAWIEFLSYKLLFAAFLVALGNSNATVRQIFDAVVT